MDLRASRRLTVLSQHLGEQGASGAAPAGEVELQPLSGRAAASQGASTSYASATGAPSSYARVHGAASRAPARWRRIDTVAKEQLREVRYEKAQGEGIAKVGGGSGDGVLGLQVARCSAGPPHPASATLPIPRRSPSTGRRSATPSRPAQVRRWGGRTAAAAAPCS